MTSKSVDRLRHLHFELSGKTKEGTTPEVLMEVKNFINDCRDAGRSVSDLTDREYLKSLLRRWGEFMVQHSEDAEDLDLNLLPFEGEAVVGRVRKAISFAIRVGVVIVILLAIIAVVTVIHSNNPITALLAIFTPIPTSTTPPTVTSTSTPTPSDMPTLLLTPTLTDTPMPPTDTPVLLTDTPVPPVDTPVPLLEITGIICRLYNDPVDMDGNKVFLPTRHFDQFGYDHSGFWATVVNPQTGNQVYAQIIAFKDANDTRMRTWDECDFALKRSMREDLGGDLTEVTDFELEERPPRKLVFIYTAPTQD